MQGLVYALVVCCVASGVIKSRAPKELFEEGILRGPWVKGISFYLIAKEGDPLEINNFKGVTDPVKKSFLGRPERCHVSRWVVGGVQLALCRWGFTEYCGLLPWNRSHSLAFSSPFLFFLSHVLVMYLK